MVSFAEYDMKNVEPGGSFEPIPAGEYAAILTHCEKKKTKRDANCEGLSLKFQILSGQYQNRMLFAWLNTKNSNVDAQNIGRRELKSLMSAVGLPDAANAEELYNKPLTIKVAIGKDQNGNPRNEIKGYKSRSESNAQQQTSMMADAFAQPAQTTSAIPANPFAKK